MSSIDKIAFIKPHFPSADEISEDYSKIVSSNWFTNFGPYENKLCREVEAFVGRGTFATTVANATLGIELAVMTLLKKDQKRNKVIVPSFTFIAGPAVLIEHGFTPVLIDINEEIQPKIKDAEEYIINNKEDVAGILLCNIFGVGNPEIDKWEALASKHGLPLIIDTAAGFGSQYTRGRDDEYVGSRGDCEIFSMHATKPFSVGEGGLVLSKDKELINTIRQLQNFGFDENRKVVGIGTNAKLQELNCAIGLRQIAKFRDRLENRQESLLYYKTKLEPLGYTFQPNDELSTVAFVSAVAPTKESALRCVEALKKDNIDVKRYYSPLHDIEAIKRSSHIPYKLKVTNDIAARILSLPLHDSMSTDTIDRIVNVIRGATI